MKITRSQLKRLIEAEFVRSHKPKLTTPAEEPEESEYSYGGPSFDPAQQKVADLIGDLADAIKTMERSTPDLVDHYVVLFRTLEDAGVNLSYLADLSSRK